MIHVLGLSAFYHESACCLLRDGRLVAAAAEERFSRVKHDAGLPVRAFRFCLEQAGLDVTDLDVVAYYEEPVPKLARQLWAGNAAGDRDDGAWLDPQRPERQIREGLGWDGPLWSFPHHLSHATAAFELSGFPDAAVLVADGVGEWATTSYGRAAVGRGIELFHQVDFPHSLGLFYSAVTTYLGFRVLGGEAKVMGLAAYGEPRFAERLRRMVRSIPENGDFRLDPDYFDFARPGGGGRMYSDAWEGLLGVPPRSPDTPPEEVTGSDGSYRDLAASAQVVLEEILLEKTRWLHGREPSRRLCLAGGVALNGVANGRLLRDGPFERIFAPPAPGDQGACVGAAFLAHRRLQEVTAGDEPLPEPSVSSLPHAFWGSGWADEDIEGVLSAAQIPAESFAGRDGELLALAAKRLAEGAVVGWFSGRSELGPRALGARNILADPRHGDVRDRVNRVIKRREGFRPFAPAVLAEHAADHFDLPEGGRDLARFMLLVCPVDSSRQLPAVTHVDGSARPQIVERAHAPRFAALLDAFCRLTGCPVLLSTSFNVRGQPLVESPVDALVTMVDAGLDALVLGERWIERTALPEVLPAMLRSLDARPGGPGRHRNVADRVASALYTFV